MQGMIFIAQQINLTTTIRLSLPGGVILLNSGLRFDGIGHIGFFPSKSGFVTAKMSIGRGRPVNGAQKIQVFDNGGRPKVKDVQDNLFCPAFSDFTGAHEVDHDAHRLGNADGVGHLHFALFSQTGGHQVFGHVAPHIGGTAVYLGGVFTRKTAAAVASLPAVGVYNNLSSGESAVAHGAAHDETARGVDKIAGVAVDHFRRDGFF